MFSRNDRALIAASGGKDSMLLAHYLLELGYSPDLLFIDLGIKGFNDYSYIAVRDFSSKYNINLYVAVAREYVGFSIDDIAGEYSGSICSICGSVKRKIFNRFAVDNQYDVLLTGHNMDDEVRFLFSNNKKWNWAYLKKSIPLLSSKNGFIKRAKPLAYIREEESRMAAGRLSFPYIQEGCPYVVAGNQKKYQSILKLSEEKFPGFVNEYYFSFLRNYDFLSHYEDNVNLISCEKCGDLTTSSICKVCSVKERIWRKG